MKKKTIFIGMVSSILVLNGCAGMGPVRLEYCEKTGTTEKCVKGEYEPPANDTTFIGKNVNELLAYLGFFSFSDWESFDPSQLVIRMTGQNVDIKTPSNEVLITLTSNGDEVVSKLFNTVKWGADVKFANPSAVKDWTLLYVDVVDKIDFELMHKVYDTSNIMNPNVVLSQTVSTIYNGDELSTTTEFYQAGELPKSGGPLGTHEEYTGEN